MTINSHPVIGFLGVGAIGKPMAECLLERYSVVICDADASARSAFAGRAPVVSTASELGAAADMVFACLPSLKSYERAILDEEGLMAGGRVRHFVHLGTTGPDLSIQMGAALHTRGIDMLDAPISGGPARAKAGDLVVMTSGPRALFDLAEKYIRCFASSVVHLGENPGQAQTMKLINNVLSAANLAVASEVMLLGVKVGLDPEQMLQVINAGTGANSATRTKIPDHVIRRSFDYGGRLELVQKDLALFVREAAKFGLNASLSTLVDATYRTAIAEDGANADMTEVIRHMERAAGVELGSSRAS